MSRKEYLDAGVIDPLDGDPDGPIYSVGVRYICNGFFYTDHIVEHLHYDDAWRIAGDWTAGGLRRERVLRQAGV